MLDAMKAFVRACLSIWVIRTEAVGRNACSITTVLGTGRALEANAWIPAQVHAALMPNAA